jgi:plastocyanin
MWRTRIIGLAVALISIAVGSVLAARVPAEAGGGCHEPATDARGVSVDLKELCMIPTVLRVDAGETVTWTNRDEVTHTVTGANIRSGQPGPGSWGSAEEIQHGESVSHEFDRDGVYPYYCLLHPGMVGAVVVGDGNAQAFASTFDGALPTAAPSPVAAAQSNDEGGFPTRAAAFSTIAALGVVIAGGAGWRVVRRRR